jgi:uncharacterized protein (TIGR03032 family)
MDQADLLLDMEKESTSSTDIEFFTSRQFVAWLIEQNLSIAFSTYQSGKVFFLGHNDKHELSIFERTFERPMGLWSDGQVLLLSSLYQIFRFQNTLPEGEFNEGYDRLFVPQVSYVTGDLDVHDIHFDQETQQPVFANTLFSCLATTSYTHSFEPLWQPGYISELMPEDRCHLNGLAVKDNDVTHVTAVSATDITDGWREHRNDGGRVIDISNNETVCEGLSMPHSPRWHDDRLWVANSGEGEFGYVDLDSGKFEPVVFCPGYIRGVAFHGDFAIIGLSKPRHNKTFQGLGLDARLEQAGVAARSGLYVVNLKVPCPIGFIPRESYPSCTMWWRYRTSNAPVSSVFVTTRFAVFSRLHQTTLLHK